MCHLILAQPSHSRRFPLPSEAWQRSLNMLIRFLRMLPELNHPYPREFLSLRRATSFSCLTAGFIPDGLRVQYRKQRVRAVLTPTHSGASPWVSSCQGFAGVFIAFIFFRPISLVVFFLRFSFLFPPMFSLSRWHSRVSVFPGRTEEESAARRMPGRSLGRAGLLARAAALGPGGAGAERREPRDARRTEASRVGGRTPEFPVVSFRSYVLSPI